MKNMLLGVIVLAALSACSQKPAEQPTAEPAAAEPAAAPVTADASLTKDGHIGVWTTSEADGTLVDTTTINADDTYLEVMKADGKEEKGTWAMEQGKTCFDPTGDDPAQPKRCFIVGAADKDGARQIQGDDGKQFTVRKIS